MAAGGLLQNNHRNRRQIKSCFDFANQIESLQIIMDSLLQILIGVWQPQDEDYVEFLELLAIKVVEVLVGEQAARSIPPAPTGHIRV